MSACADGTGLHFHYDHYTLYFRFGLEIEKPLVRRAFERTHMVKGTLSSRLSKQCAYLIILPVMFSPLIQHLDTARFRMPTTPTECMIQIRTVSMPRLNGHPAMKQAHSLYGVANVLACKEMRGIQQCD